LAANRVHEKRPPTFQQKAFELSNFRPTLRHGRTRRTPPYRLIPNLSSIAAEMTCFRKLAICRSDLEAIRMVDLSPNSAKPAAAWRRIYFSDGMKAERSKTISAPIRIWAATCLIVWALGFSVAVIAQVCSCCDTVSKGCGNCGDKAAMCGGAGSHSTDCGSEHSSGCCDKRQSHQSCGSNNGCSLTAMELKPALPLVLWDSSFVSMPAPLLQNTQFTRLSTSAAPALFSTHEQIHPIPPELRLGSALWSHAPPVRAA
jgi:hypothetical protein